MTWREYSLIVTSPTQQYKREITWGEFNKMSNRFANLLLTRGIKKGDKVAIWEKTSIDAVEMFLAALSAGYIGIILPTGLPEQAVIGCCMKFGVKLLAVRDEFAGKVAAAPCKLVSSSSMADREAPSAAVSKDDPAAIFFTGGTTGAPKGAILPHRALMRGSFKGGVSPGSQLGHHRMVCLLPLSHVFGLVRSTLSAFYTGSLWYPAEDMKATIGKLPVIKPTLLVLVPGLCDILYGLTRMYGPQFLGGELKTIIAGAANVPPRLISEFDKLGIALTPDQIKLVTQRVVELGDKKEMMTPEDLPFIIADVLKSGATQDNIHIVNYSLQLTKGMKPAAMLKVSINGTEYETSSNGDGQYNAFMRALWKIYDRLGKKHPLLADYQVTIPPGGKTDALVATTIFWDMDGHVFKTRGIDSDQTEAAIKATLKMLNIVENTDLKLTPNES